MKCIVLQQFQQIEGNSLGEFYEYSCELLLPRKTNYQAFGDIFIIIKF